jgi:GT2 family glycosyltransferase
MGKVKMAEKTKVSACIVTYNNAGQVEKTVESLLRHTQGVALQVYVVDNGSSDTTVESLQHRFPQVMVLPLRENRGFGAGHNRILPQLSSQYHAIVNPDIALDSDVLTQMADYLDGHPEVGMLSPKLLFPNGEVQVLAKRNPHFWGLVSRNVPRNWMRKTYEHYCMLDEDLSKPIQIGFAAGCFMFIRTELFVSLGGFDERFFLYDEDADLTRRVNQVSKAVYHPDMVVYHDWQRGYWKTPKLFWTVLISNLKYLWKWRHG